MMRRPRTPQKICGQSRAQGWWQDAAGHAFVLTRVLLVLAVFAPLFAASNVFAQDPSILGTPTTKGSSFGNASMFGKINKNLDKAAPLNLQGDQLIYDTQGNRVIARGNVEIFYNDYILTADEVIYDQNASTLTAVGNVTLKEPQGNIVRADRYTLTDDFRDGFVQSLSIETKDDTRITAEQATRREGNVTEFRNGRFTPCKSDGSTPPLWCLSAARIIHDKDAQTITYQDATFDVYGQPILYLPYFQHADPTVKRKSGLLTPTFGQSKTLGFMTQIPTILRWRRTTTSPSSPDTCQNRASCGTASGATGWPTANIPFELPGSIRTGATCPFRVRRTQTTARTTMVGVALLRPGVSFRSRVGGNSAGT